MADWRPIETAPTDGTLVIVYAPRARSPAVVIQAANATGKQWWSLIGRLRPTHWMPLDPPDEAVIALRQYSGAPIGGWSDE